MTVTGKLELTIKINELPKVAIVENGAKSFEIDCDGQLVSVTVKPKVWKKLEDAQANGGVLDKVVSRLDRATKLKSIDE